MITSSRFSRLCSKFEARFGMGKGRGGEREIERKRDTMGRMREKVRKEESGRESQIKTQLMETMGAGGLAQWQSAHCMCTGPGLDPQWSGEGEREG